MTEMQGVLAIPRLAESGGPLSLDRVRWIVLVASCLVNLCIGSLYAWSVFASPMTAHLNAVNGFDVGSLAVVFSVANAVGPVTMISGGVVNDRLGPRWVILAGGVLFGAGMIGAGFSSSVGMLVVTYGLGCGLGMGLVYGIKCGEVLSRQEGAGGRHRYGSLWYQLGAGTACGECPHRFLRCRCCFPAARRGDASDHHGVVVGDQAVP